MNRPRLQTSAPVKGRHVLLRQEGVDRAPPEAHRAVAQYTEADWVRTIRHGVKPDIPVTGPHGRDEHRNGIPGALAHFPEGGHGVQTDPLVAVLHGRRERRNGLPCRRADLAQGDDGLHANAPVLVIQAAHEGRHGEAGEEGDAAVLHRAAFGTEYMTIENRRAMMSGPEYDPEGDLVVVAPDGRLLVSTTDNVSVTGASGVDEDLLAFAPALLGATTSGTWSLYFDGSDVGLSNTSNEDINGVWIDNLGKIYLTTLGNFSVTGASGDGSDIFVCTPGSLGSTTACTYGMYWDGSVNGFSGEDTDSLGIVPG